MANNQNDTKISVSLKALREVLTALNNPAGYAITELQVTRDQGRGLFLDNPIDVLIAEYKEFVAANGWPTSAPGSPSRELVAAKVELYVKLLAIPKGEQTPPNDTQLMCQLVADTSIQVLLDAAAVQAMVTGGRNESQPR